MLAQAGWTGVFVAEQGFQVPATCLQLGVGGSPVRPADPLYLWSLFLKHLAVYVIS